MEDKIIIQDTYDGTESEDFEDEAVIRGNDERENAIEWYTGGNRLTVTLSQRKLINKIKRLSTDNPEDVQIVKENPDGTLLAHLPYSYLKISRPRQISDETRQKMSEQGRRNVEAGLLVRKKTG